ncbi:hypothetical protein [Lactobacillus delbrueckii]|uniref:hypothetical protein n=1 Tax=Lactobacillus delbrueckii TaxID=1584 RepID=UPI002072B18F|nr:hypothetical protein [Lactobacillus delbrueckii]
MEGCAGVTSWEQTHYGHKGYDLALKGNRGRGQGLPAGRLSGRLSGDRQRRA